MTGVTYDFGPLIAAERSERRMWARHRALLLRRIVPTVPAPVIAQCWRGTPRQAQLARLLAGGARVVDIVDTSVIEGALRRDDLIISSDEDNLTAIAAAAGRRVDIDHP